MRISVLGPVVVDPLGPSLSPRDRVVLTALALDSGDVVSGERLADALWGSDVPSSWNKVVQGCIVRLRKALGTEAIETHPRGYRLSIPPDEIDLRRFERLLRRAHELMTLGQAERAMVAADEALSLWRGRPLMDVEDWEPAQSEARRLEEMRLHAEELRLEAALRSGRHREVLALARAGVDAAPTRERRWELLALAQYRAASQGDALRTLSEARSALRRELGVDPGADLVALEQAILRQDSDLRPPPAPAEANATCPWPGLLAYGIGDAETFFGRERETAICLDRLAADGVVVVVGASGSGKSSLIRAGIAASLRRNGRRVTIVTPGGARPTDALTSSLSNDGSAVLLVDQCEEAVILCDDPIERAAFFEALVAHASEAPLVVALRADRVSDVSAHDDFARLVERGLFLLGPMAEGDIREAIEGPARRAGLLLEPGLIDLIARDVLDEPGALPLMSHALRQTWAQRQGRTLTVDAYRQTGGIRGAVARSAEDVYASVEPDQRSKLRDLLLRLIAPGDNSEPARARVPRHVLAGQPGNEELIERLVAARLLTSDEEVVELAHEALARAWPRLKDWLHEDVEGVRTLRHLTAAATEWEALDRPTSELYRGVRLAQALEWRARTQPELTAPERAFLDASIELEAAQTFEAQAQVAREQRTVQRLRRLVVGVALFAVVAVVASSVALEQRRRAHQEARVAEARRVSAQALVARPHDRALLLAVEAVRLWDTPETQGNLLATIAKSPHMSGVLRNERSRPLDVELTPDGRGAAVVDAAGDLTLYDAATRKEVAKRSEDAITFGSPAFSPDGRDLAVSRSANCRHETSCATSVDVLASDDLRRRRVAYRGLHGAAAHVAYSPDGSMLAAAAHFAAAAPHHNVAIWRVGEPAKPLRRLTLEHRGSPRSSSPDAAPRSWIRFSPDGTHVYASGAGPTTMFEVASGAPVRTFDGQGALALDHQGRTIAIATDAFGVALVDTSTGEARTHLVGHRGLITAAAFSSDSRLIATTSNDETVAVWDAATGERLRLLEGHAGSVGDVAFDVGGETLYTAGADRSVFIWNIGRSSGLARSLGAPSPDSSAGGVPLVSPTADSVALLSDRARIVGFAPRRVTALPVGAPEVTWGSYSVDGRSLVTVGPDGSTKLWRIADGALVASRPGRGRENFGAVAFTHDGGAIVVADGDGVVVELDATTLEPTGREVDVDVPVAGIRTAPRGRFAVVAAPVDGSGGTDVVFGDLRSKTVTRRLRVDSEAPRANFSADGARYAVGGFDGRIRVIDVATGTVAGPRDPVHAGPVSWVTFSPDGTTIASIGFDGELVLADAATGLARARVVPGARNQHATVGYHPDGHTAVVAYLDGTAIAYETDPQAWVTHACRVAARNLTGDEWRDTFGGERRRRTCVDAH